MNNGVGYYPPYGPYFNPSERPPLPPPATGGFIRNDWEVPQQQYTQSVSRGSATYNPNTINHNTGQHNYSHNQNSYGNNRVASSRGLGTLGASNHSASSHGAGSHGSLRSRGYNNNSSTHSNNGSYFRNNRHHGQHSQYNSGSQQHGWQRNQNSYKRNRLDSSESEPQLKTTKKKKKPLSQNVPNKKDWTMEEAALALSTEKELNKKSKNALIIKFPDQELNKDIVGQLHASIENVHFQQPCTPRFCFITLQESADPEEVISALNKKQFGHGLLTVEYKKDREEDQTINPEDIDPLTLYVGNLAQEITKDDMLSTYPTSKRIDIGFAKKMKFTRYAFVGFKTASDSLEAFRKTHNMQMYNKSLIVRFRRLHGTVGMPGESKPQNPPKSRDPISVAIPSDYAPISLAENIELHTKDKSPAVVPESSSVSVPQPVDSASTQDIFTDTSSKTTNLLSVGHIKQENSSPTGSGDEDEDGPKPIISDILKNHKPMITDDIKTENGIRGSLTVNMPTIKSEINQQPPTIKHEPYDSNDDIDWELYYNNEDSDDGEEDDTALPGMTDFNSVYESLVIRANNISTLKKTGI